MGKQVSLRNLLANFKFFVKILHGDGQVPQARYAGGVDVDNKRVADDTVVMSYEEWLERPWHSYLGREDQCCLERQRWHFKSLRSSAAFGLGTFDHNNDGTPCHTLLPESGISDFIERMYEMGQENPKVFTAWDLACHSIVRNVVTAIVGFENSQFPFSGWVPDWFKVLLPYVDRLSDALKDEPTTIESLRAIQVSVPGCAEYPLFHSCFPASASKLADLLRLLIACLQKDKSLMIGTVPREVYDPFLAAVPIYAGSSKKKVRKGLALDDCAVPAGSHFVGPNLTRGKTAEKRKLNALD